MEIQSYIDHTLLKPTSTTADIETLCKEAVAHRFAAVCVAPCYASFAKKIISTGPLALATVIGFPLGYNHTQTKLQETHLAIADGADEVDVVMNLAAFFSGEMESVLHEIQSVTSLAHSHHVRVKWIIEAGILSPSQIECACALAVQAGVDFVKTSTGFNGGGATPEMIAQLRYLLPPHIKIKASGGIKTFEQAKQLIEAGADRLGTSSALLIIKEAGSV